MAVTKELVSDSVHTEVITVTVIPVTCPQEDGEPAYRIDVERRPTNFGTPYRRHKKLNQTQTGLSLCQRRVRRPQRFNCHASFPASYATGLHEEACWKHFPTLFFSFTAAFWVFEVISKLSHMRKSVPESREFPQVKSFAHV